MAPTTERQREQARRWKADHPERVREQKAQWKKDNPDKVREQRQRANANGAKGRAAHGMRMPDRRKVHVDHDHTCCPQGKSCRYCRRGLACHPCNLLIGFARDDPQRLRRIARNLEAALAATQHRMAGKAEQVVLLA